MNGYPGTGTSSDGRPVTPRHDIVDSARTDLELWREDLAPPRLDGDGFFVRLLRRLSGPGWGSLEAELEALTPRLGDDLDVLVCEDNRDENLPVVRRHDRFGNPIEEVVFHPAHHEIGRVFWASRVLSVLGEPGSEVHCGALAYLLDRHGEAGHACPVACTAGAVKLLQRVGTEGQRSRYLPGLLDPDYDTRLHAAQFVTEVQGGSDVGSNAVRAVPDPDRPGWYRISGEKWFCSVADAGLFVVSARLEGAPEGTRGLGLFLVPRNIDGVPNGFQLRRLKYKLGTRSMPTGEIDFDGALGEPIGDLGDGFRNLVGIVLDTSRVHNAVAACGIMRRAVEEAAGYADRRSAFGHRIGAFPAVQALVARMHVRSRAALATTFRILDMTDRLDTGEGDDELRAARRIAVMINKYWTALAATRTTRDGIEVLGGNGTIEDFSVLPRLYRDAIVVESWEGTHNTLCAQVLRDFATRGLHLPWLAVLEREVGSLGDGAEATTARELLEGVRDDIDRLLAADEMTAMAWMRTVVDRMCVLTDWVAVATQAAWDADHDGGTESRDVLALLRRLDVASRDRLDDPDRIGLEQRLASMA